MSTENVDEYDDDVGLGAEDKKYARSNNLEWFKGEKNRTYRVALGYFHPLDVAVAKACRKKDPAASKETIQEALQKQLAKRAEELGKPLDQLAEFERLDTTNVRFKKVEAHYKEGVGYCISRLGKDGAEADAVWKTMGDVKTYFTTVLIIYPTNREGELVKDQLGTHTIVVPWRFSNKIYGTLHQRSAGLRENGLSIANQDLILKCTNTDFQNFDIDPAGPSIWQKHAKFASTILGKAYALYPKLVPFRELSTADLKIKLGLGGPAGSDASVEDQDFSSLIDQV